MPRETRDRRRSDDDLRRLTGISSGQFCTLYLQATRGRVSEVNHPVQRIAHMVLLALASRGYRVVLCTSLKAHRVVAPPVKWVQDMLRHAGLAPDGMIVDSVSCWHSLFSQSMGSRDILNMAPIAAQAVDDGIIESLCEWSMGSDISGETGLLP